MSRRRKIILGSFIVLVVVVAVIARAVISRLDQPVSGAITVASSTTTTTPGFDFTPQHISGTYALFNYPKSLIVAHNNPLVNPVVAQYNFTYHDIESWNLAIAILATPGGSLASNNAYQFRKSQPNIYKESHETFNNQAVDIMTDTTVGGFSKVAFLESSNFSATVSLEGDDSAGISVLSKTFNMILSSWQWR